MQIIWETTYHSKEADMREMQMPAELFQLLLSQAARRHSVSVQHDTVGAVAAIGAGYD
jgi:hypothetical protein